MAAKRDVLLGQVLEDGELAAGLVMLLAGRGAVGYVTSARRGGRLAGPGHVAYLAAVEATEKAGAETLDLGRGASEPGGPKSDLGPTEVPFGRLEVTRRRLAQPLLDAAFGVKGALWRVRQAGRRPS
jgi:hypothetical protein